jgi:hypothetical protein
MVLPGCSCTATSCQFHISKALKAFGGLKLRIDDDAYLLQCWAKCPPLPSAAALLCMQHHMLRAKHPAAAGRLAS